MRRKTALILLGGLISLALYSQDRPKADDRATVVCGKARFTILTERIIRLEWADDGIFEDRASQVIVNRHLPIPEFSVSRKDSTLSVKTSSISLTYHPDREDGFTENNLNIEFRMNGHKVSWRPGEKPSGNLKGTIRTLDKIKGRSGKNTLSYWNKYKQEFEPVELEDGVISRDGWVIIDDSKSLVFEPDESDWGQWVCKRQEGKRQDLYFMAYGHDYIHALADYTKLAGRIPLPPKYAFGYWWSRYWAYSDDELRDIASQMRTRGIPMDVVIVDMDWHETWKEMDSKYGKDEFGQRHGWTGYTWNKSLFPDPAAFIKDIHALGYKIALNLHPASGIQPYEEPYGRFVKDYLNRTSDYDGPAGYVYSDKEYIFKGNNISYAVAGKQAPVPFRLDQQAWADSYFETVIHPMEDIGIDFWWLDWQQWKESKYIEGLSSTYWCNWAFWNDKARQEKHSGKEASRPIIYHRWGGLGSHRYQIGFSGDTYDEWSALQMLPYFTATASNVCYGYWGHDIGGHMQLVPHDTDPELYTRWLQFGVFTPIFRTHSASGIPGSGQSGTIDPAELKAREEVTIGLERKIWAYPTHYPYMKAAIELRYALSPYIYSAAREAYDTGISMCRPLYYYYPEEELAYEMDNEYFFGDNILATALSHKAVDGKTTCRLWMPEGCNWYDMAERVMRKGGTVGEYAYSIDQNPWFVREGAVIPMAGADIQNLQNATNELELLVVPGRKDCIINHYEDDGLSMSYTDDHAFTTITKHCTGKTTTLSISARKGSYKGACSTRRIKIKFEAVTERPRKILYNNQSWTEFQLSDNVLTVCLPESSVNETQTLRICF